MPPRNRTSTVDVDASDADATTAAPQTTRVAESTPEPAKAEEAPKSDSDSGSSESSGIGYLNTTSGPIIYDKEGHLVGGGEWVTVSGLDAIGKAARAHGYLAPRSAL